MNNWATSTIADQNPEAAFLNGANRELMLGLTRLDLNKVFQKKVAPNDARIEFATLEELKRKQEKAIEKAHEMLQMPPVVQVCS